ncbi:MAG: hypothetical protein PHZ24_03810 [Bacteroidales bacterium]|nr:hypothetical protein [Bacteroidales bacterium]
MSFEPIKQSFILKESVVGFGNKESLSDKFSIIPVEYSSSILSIIKVLPAAGLSGFDEIAIILRISG